MRRSSNVHSKGDEQNHEVEDKTGWKSHLDLIAAFNSCNNTGSRICFQVRNTKYL